MNNISSQTPKALPGNAAGPFLPQATVSKARIVLTVQNVPCSAPSQAHQLWGNIFTDNGSRLHPAQISSPRELQVRESITESMCTDRLKLQQFLGFEIFPQSFSLLLAASCNCLLHHSQKPWHRGPHKTAHKHIKMDHCI